MNNKIIKIESQTQYDELVASHKLKNNMVVEYECDVCGKYVVRKYRSARHHNKLCQKCQTEKTSLEKYGVKSPQQSQIVKAKKKATFIKRYGVDNNMKSKVGIKAWRDSYKVKTGYEHNWQNPECRKRCAETSKRKFGEDNYNNREKAEQTNLKHCGFRCNLQSEESKRKARETCNKLYGCDYALQNDDIKQKAKDTCQERYGMDHHPSYKYCYDGISFDSGWELAYYVWLKDSNIDFVYPCDVIFKYTDSFGKERTYQPDFRVGNRIIEIKGTQFIDSGGKLFEPYEFKNDKQKTISADRCGAKNKIIEDNNIKVLSRSEMKFYLNYVSEKYGKDHLKQFRNNA